MKKILLAALLVLWSLTGSAQAGYQLETSDITNFWIAFDQLQTARTRADSIHTIQTLYIEKSSPFFKEFIRVRGFTAMEYVQKIAAYPKFWNSVRPLTESIVNRKDEIHAVFEKLKQEIPDYRQPDVCFAIGCLRTGGTTTKDLILIGSEIAAADASVEKSELTLWLKSVIGHTEEITSMIAHEAIHTHQRPLRKPTLLQASLLEGTADFIPIRLMGLNANSNIHHYGNDHECAVWTSFEQSMKANPKDYSRWLYNGNAAKGMPADMGYFVGFKIAESFFNQQADKRKALKMLLDYRKYGKVYKLGGYWKKACG